MADGQAAGGTRYTAFISYSHKDAGHARWLHRKLEGYRIPRRLAGTDGEHGPIPARLTPIFRDREELPAAGDLTERVRAALAASDTLIVLCSPDAAASLWVAREIEVFRALHPGRPIYAAIVAGDPADCFPPALHDGSAAEPLAADLRKDRDGRRLGLLKLVAGLAGVGLDALVQRDAARRVRRVTAVTALALIALLSMSVLTVVALRARAEAERQRAEAEGLIEFMLTDLRERLKGVGRLDVMTAVNQRALGHYARQELRALSSDQLQRRAEILHAMGEDEATRGDDEGAMRLFREAARTTEALLAQEPDNPERIYGHAQSEFWVGYIDYQRGDFARARPPFQRYRSLAGRLLDIDPDNPEWRKEAGYAEGNLCSTALGTPADPAEALRACLAALDQMETAARLAGDPTALASDLANRHAWLADAYLENKRYREAMDQRRRQEALLETQIERDPRNMNLRDLLVTNQMALAGLEARLGNVASARRRLSQALEITDMLVVWDPSNGDWAKRRRDVRAKLTALNAD